jgi:hypothetical protein
MPPSPLANLEEYIFAAPFSAAPRKARLLWERFSREHPLVLVDQPGFWFRAHEEHVEVSYASLETLWYAAYCYTVVYNDRVREQARDNLTPLVLQDPTAHNAIDRYRWFLSRLHERTDTPWPSDAPTPSIANDDSPERHATEFFLVALAWVLHHEFGHLLLQRPIDDSIPEKDREWEADAHATEWLFDNENDPNIRRKLFVGACIALGLLCARKPPTEDSETHPPAYDRLAKMLQAATPADDEPAYAFALSVLLTNWAVNGHETWIQAKDEQFKELFLAFGRVLRQEEQDVWVRINEQGALLYERVVTGPISGDEQRALAHVLWEERGQPDGAPEVDWYNAEKIIRHTRWTVFLEEVRKQWWTSPSRGSLRHKTPMTRAHS